MTLPDILDIQEQLTLIAAAHNGDNNALESLVEHNLRLVGKIISEKFPETPYEYDDLFQIGSIGLLKAIKRITEQFYNSPNLDKIFISYCCGAIENGITTYIRSESRKNPIYAKKIVDIEKFSYSPNFINFIDQKEHIERLYLLLNTFKKKERIFIEYKYGICNKEKLSQKMIAKRLKIRSKDYKKYEKKVVAKFKNEVKTVFYSELNGVL